MYDCVCKHEARKLATQRRVLREKKLFFPLCNSRAGFQRRQNGTGQEKERRRRKKTVINSVNENKTVRNKAQPLREKYLDEKKVSELQKRGLSSLKKKHRFCEF